MQVQRTIVDADKQIDQALKLILGTIPTKVLGVYHYGSYTLGGLQPHSDIDIFVLLNSSTDDNEKAQLLKGMLEISIEDPSDIRRPVELNIATQSQLKPWTGLPNMDFQFGEWMRQDFESGNNSPWPNPNTDLAIIVTQVLQNGKTLYGEETSHVLDPIPWDDVKSIMVSEIVGLTQELQDDTRNVLLTLIRIWNSLETNAINSKQDAAVWAIEKVPDNFKPLLRHALAVCLGEEAEDWSKYQTLTQPFSEYLVAEIQKLETTGSNTEDTLAI